MLEEGIKRGTCLAPFQVFNPKLEMGIDSIKVEMGNPCLAHEEILQVMEILTRYVVTKFGGANIFALTIFASLHNHHTDSGDLLPRARMRSEG